LGFIGYQKQREVNGDEVVRIYLECEEKPASETACGYAVDVIFAGGGAPCRLRGVEGVLVLKKFYKLLFSLEERAREHGNDWRAVMESAERLLEHLRYTRNARDFSGVAEPRLRAAGRALADPECAASAKGL